MRVEAAIFSFWQGVAEAPIPRRALALGSNAAKSEKGRYPSLSRRSFAKAEGASAQMVLRGVEPIGDSHSMDTPQCARLATGPSERKRRGF